MSWTYSDNDEEFRGDIMDTREEAIEGVKEEYGGGYIGRVVPIPPFTVNTDYVIDGAREDAYDFADDASDGWLDEIPNGSEEELESELSKVFNDWLKKYHLEPTFYQVDSIEKVEDDE